MISKHTDSLIEELYKIDGKAEIVGGEIVRMSPTGNRPSRAGGKIFASLLAFEEANPGSSGVAFPDNMGFLVDLPNRKSFSPDAAFCFGTDQSSMRFAERAPDFAVEIRSENDYGPAAEKSMAEKRADYFAAGTKVVWDVDLQSENVITAYRSDAPTNGTVFRAGELANAEPAVPGWTFPVDRLSF